MAPEEGVPTSVKRQKVFLLYPYYWPLYKAGGPVQSLFNIAVTFRGVCEFFILSLDRDMDLAYPEPPVKTFCWVTGPNGEHIFFVPSTTPTQVFKILREVDPDVVFINGIFNVRTTIPGLLWSKVAKTRRIISPRGMLQPWGLERNQFVKKIFLACLKLMVKGNEHWHSTDENEVQDIKRIFGEKQQIHVASNIPRKVSTYTDIQFPGGKGKISLVFLSLINRNKNLHLIIEAMNRLSSRFSLDIFGPIIDKKYWELCLSKISDTNAIQYKGSVPPWQVPDLLAGYHFFVLPTQGENFGHAIFDALASGVPVIISKNTPWHDIEVKQAGFYLDLAKDNSVTEILQKVSVLDSKSYRKLRKGSISYAQEYWEHKDYRSEYDFLFNGA